SGSISWHSTIYSLLIRKARAKGAALKIANQQPWGLHHLPQQGPYLLLIADPSLTRHLNLRSRTGPRTGRLIANVSSRGNPSGDLSLRPRMVDHPGGPAPRRERGYGGRRHPQAQKGLRVWGTFQRPRSFRRPRLSRSIKPSCISGR